MSVTGVSVKGWSEKGHPPGQDTGVISGESSESFLFLYQIAFSQLFHCC